MASAAIATGAAPALGPWVVQTFTPADNFEAEDARATMMTNGRRRMKSYAAFLMILDLRVACRRSIAQPFGRLGQLGGAGSSIRLANPSGTKETTTVTRFSLLLSFRTT